MKQLKFVWFLGGLLLFVFLSILLCMIEVPYLGQWEIVIEGLGWIVILTGAAYLARNWLAPTLIAAALFLMTAGERWTRSLLEQSSDSNIFIVMVLTLVVNGATLVLLLIGLFLMFRGGVRHFFPPKDEKNRDIHDK